MKGTEARCGERLASLWLALPSSPDDAGWGRGCKKESQRVFCKVPDKIR